MNLIDKDAVVAEIERRITQFYSEKSKKDASVSDKLSLGGRIAALEEFKVFINTLEVKEGDVEKEVNEVFFKRTLKEEDKLTHKQLMVIAKHFFELGLKSQKDMYK